MKNPKRDAHSDFLIPPSHTVQVCNYCCGCCFFVIIASVQVAALWPKENAFEFFVSAGGAAFSQKWKRIWRSWSGKKWTRIKSTRAGTDLCAKTFLMPREFFWMWVLSLAHCATKVHCSNRHITTKCISPQKFLWVRVGAEKIRLCLHLPRREKQRRIQKCEFSDSLKIGPRIFCM